MSEYIKHKCPEWDGSDNEWDNFKFCFLQYMTGVKLRDVINGTNVDEEKQEQAFTLIVSALNKKALFAINTIKPFADKPKSAMKAWAALVASMDAKSASRRTYLVGKFTGCKMTSSESVQDFIIRLDNLIFQLEQINEIFSDALKIGQLLNNLLPKFDNMVSPILAKNLSLYSEVRTEVLSSSIRYEDMDNERRQYEDVGESQALAFQ